MESGPCRWRGTVRTWHGVDLEAGDTTGLHYGVAVDLGSTTVVARLVDCATERLLGRNQHVQRADPLWNGHSDQNLFTVRKTVERWRSYEKQRQTSITTCVREQEAQQQLTGKQLYRDGNRGQYNDDSFSAWDGCVLCLPHSVCGARRPARISPGKRSGTAGEGICLHLSGKVQLPGRRYHQRHGGYGNL